MFDALMRKVKIMKNPLQTNTVAVIGAGPVRIAAAAQLQARGLTPLVLEQGARDPRRR
tara:strand:+ start:24 stop:197 length:174 start_codon:yes stop_codon:yes gene_type:complete